MHYGVKVEEERGLRIREKYVCWDYVNMCTLKEYVSISRDGKEVHIIARRSVYA